MAFLPKTEAEKKEMWSRSLFVVDANILLNLYKYSDSTREEFFKIMENLSSKLWIPHQVALEFLHNRTKKIHEQEKDYEEHLQAIDDAKNSSKREINNKLNGIKKSFRKFDIEDLTKRINKFFDDLRKEVEEQNEHNPDFNKEDIVLKHFRSLYSDNIGEPFTKEELEEVYLDGEKRYEEKVPPGYKDLEDKKGLFKLYGDTVIKSEFGDLILWKQIIHKSKQENKPVIFITDDAKEDWWNIEQQKKIKGPRKELVNEFVNLTNQEFIMYNTESFLNNAKEVLDLEVDDRAIKEVHSYIKSNYIKKDVRIDKRFYLDYFINNIDNNKEKDFFYIKENLSKEMNYVQKNINTFKARVKLLKMEYEDSVYNDQENKLLVEELDMINEEIERYILVRERLREKMIEIDYRISAIMDSKKEE